MKVNTPKKSDPVYTHEGGRADRHQTAETELRRAVSTCLLWENTFYESGDSIATRIAELCKRVKPEVVAELAREARTSLKLRHVPLWLALQLVACHYKGASSVIYDIVQRPDEMGELLALYWKDGKKPIPAQMKKGLARAFTKFSAYNLAKWNRDGQVKLKDVMFMCHPKPLDADQAATWKALVDNKLESPDTWEVALSAGANKKETWTRLLKENKLGDMALLMNLRNMRQAGVDGRLIVERLKTWSPKSVALPYRFIAAAKYAPDFEDALGEAMKLSLSQTAKLPGRTLYIVDVSGSMQAMLSGKSEMDRVDAACGLAMLLREVSEEAVIYATAGNDATRKHATAKVPPRHAFALRDAIKQAMQRLGGGGIFAYQALNYIQGEERKAFDRVIILSDEQDCDLDKNKTLAKAPLLGKFNYLMNVASYKPSLETTHSWTRISGWSERVIDWMMHNESVSNQ